MNALTPEETLRHIQFKAASNELAADLAERMIQLFEEDPARDYATLRAAAMRRELPDVVYHASSLVNRQSIASLGLLSRDPADGQFGRYAIGQPAGVYVSAEPDEFGIWVGHEPIWGIWSIAGASDLPYRQDPMNPEHFVITCDVPPSLVTFRGIRSSDPTCYTE